MKWKMRCLCFLMTLLAGCCAALGEAQYKTSFFAMDTHIQLSIYGENARHAAEQTRSLIERCEALWSATLETSEVGALNRADGAPLTVCDDTAELLSFALEMAFRTGGAFDPTVYPLVKAWGFTTDSAQIPEAETLETLLKLVGCDAVSIDGNRVQLPAGTQIDLGAVAKGWTSDLAADSLRGSGVASALLSFGGNISAVGSKSDGSRWRIGVKSPKGEGLIGILEICNESAVTSGAYERYFIGEDGRRYGHIIDPKTGWPVDNGVLSVTIVSGEGRLCDALSTALFVMGAEGAAEHWRNTRDFEMVLLTDDGTLYLTEGLEDRFIPQESDLVKEICVVR